MPRGRPSRKIIRGTRRLNTRNYFRTRVGRSRVAGKAVVHYFKRTYKQDLIISAETPAFTPILTADAGGYNQFKATDLPNYTDFSLLYDQYKICGIKRKYVLDSNMQQAGVAPAIPRLITVNDWTDSVALTDEDEALEYQSCKISRLDKVRTRYFKPAINIEDANQGNLQVVKGRWMETGSVGQGMDQAWKGLKEGLLYNSVGTSLGSLHIYTTFYIACRTPR